MTTEKTGLALMREPFPDNQISKLPKPKSKESPKGHCQECGGWHGLPAVHLDYVGHAALTARLLDADPAWTWEPVGFDDKGLPALDAAGGLWIKLSVCGTTRLGYGDAQGKTGPDAMKERIGDALRNAAMRFGAALELWHKGDLYAHLSAEGEDGADAPTRDDRRNHWIADQLAAIESAATVGALKKIVDDAITITRREQDIDAEERINSAAEAKARKARLKAAA